jgi:glycosyltransferase involved in cell wall biosynthesis
MRILVLSSTFPPHVMGGAEVSCLNLTRLLAQRGHEMSVLTMAERDEPEAHGELMPEGYRLYRLGFPRPRTLYSYPTIKRWQKPVWHLQDHLDGRSRTIFRSVLDAVKPDHINIHLLTGLGYNLLSELASDDDVGVTYFLHDLGLACVKTTMYSDDGPCAGQCLSCRASSVLKNAMLGGIERLSFASPSRANLDRVARYVPQVASRPHSVIRNLLDDLPALPPYQPAPDGTIRLLYAGRLHPAKGVDVMLRALRPLEDRFKFQVSIYGRGEQEDALRAEFGAVPWVTFGGFVDRVEVARAVVASELLCMPSVWPENYSRSILQSLVLGTPVLGSNTGGIPEQVTDGATGLLVTPGDVDAWTAAFADAFSDKVRLMQTWRDNALAFGAGFSAEAVARTYDTLVAELHAPTAAKLEQHG